MRRILLPIALAIVAPACSPAPPPAAPEPAPGGAVRRDPTPPPRPDEQPEGTATPTPEAAPSQPLADGCEGTSIDLRDAFEVGSCQVEGKGDRIPPGVTRSIEPGVMQASAGKAARGAVKLENTGSTPADVFLALPCEVDDQVRTWMEDPSTGQAIDTNQPDCEGRPASGCLATVHQIRLAPGGAARFAFEAPTAVRVWGEQCAGERRKGAVARGRYKLRVRALFLGATLDGEIIVR